MSARFITALQRAFYLVHPQDMALNDDDPEPKWLFTDGVPCFAFLIAIEFVVARVVFSRKELYRLHDLLACISLGAFQKTGQQAIVLLLNLMGFTIVTDFYRYVWDRHRWFDIDPKTNVMLCYLSCMVGKDLGYYWAHRFMHEFHILWAGHSVHHSGEDYHLGTALRQGVGQVFGFPFYLPMALLGFHPHTFAAHFQCNTLYMFWIHTDLIDRLPFPLEYILNSPMAHRMHHRPPGNCNYGGVFIVWDRLFGTYVRTHDSNPRPCASSTFPSVSLYSSHPGCSITQATEGKVVQHLPTQASEDVRKDHYGLAAQPKSFDPLTVNLAHVRRILATPGGWRQLIFGRRVPAQWSCSLSALLKPIPSQKSDQRGHGPVRPRWDGDPSASRHGTMVNMWLVVAVLICVALANRLQLNAGTMELNRAVVATTASVATFACIGQACDRRHPSAALALSLTAPTLALLAASTLSPM